MEQKRTRANKVHLWANNQELEAWQATAKSRGVSFSEWMRTVLNREAERQATLSKLRAGLAEEAA